MFNCHIRKLWLLRVCILEVTSRLTTLCTCYIWYVLHFLSFIAWGNLNYHSSFSMRLDAHDTSHNCPTLKQRDPLPSQATQPPLLWGGGDDGSGAPFHLTSLKSLFPPWAICQICQTALCAAEGRWRGGREFLGCLAIRARKEGEKGGKGQTVCV